MKPYRALIFAAVLLINIGCAADYSKKNLLRNLTDKQADWFDRTAPADHFELR